MERDVKDAIVKGKMSTKEKKNYYFLGIIFAVIGILLFGVILFLFYIGAEDIGKEGEHGISLASYISWLVFFLIMCAAFVVIGFITIIYAMFKPGQILIFEEGYFSGRLLISNKVKIVSWLDIDKIFVRNNWGKYAGDFIEIVIIRKDGKVENIKDSNEIKKILMIMKEVIPDIIDPSVDEFLGKRKSRFFFRNYTQYTKYQKELRKQFSNIEKISGEFLFKEPDSRIPERKKLLRKICVTMIISPIIIILAAIIVIYLLHPLPFEIYVFVGAFSIIPIIFLLVGILVLFINPDEDPFEFCENGVIIRYSGAVGVYNPYFLFAAITTYKKKDNNRYLMLHGREKLTGDIEISMNNPGLHKNLGLIKKAVYGAK